jgi:hypothetical protein
MKNLYVLYLIILLASCQKEFIAPEKKSENSDTVQVSQNELKALSTSWIMNASSLSSIPSQMFDLDFKYKVSYRHLKQPDGTSCSWTSYVIATGCVANATGKIYPVSSTKVYEVKNACKYLSSSSPNGIVTLSKYATNYDNVRISVSQESCSDVVTAIKKLLNHLYNYKSPCLVTSTYFGSQIYGHYLIVHAVDWRGGTGTVYYTDCAYYNGVLYNDNLKQEEISSFMNRMVTVSRSYNFLFIRPSGF